MKSSRSVFTVKKNKGVIDIDKAKDYIFKLLGQRDYSQLGLKKKLEKKGYLPAVISRAIPYFKRKGFVDDEKFAYAYARNRIAHKPRGSDLLDYELSNKGIDRSLRVKVLKKIYSERSEKDLAGEAIKKQYGKNLKKITYTENAYRFLTHRGFSLEVIESVLGQKRNFDE